MKKALIAVVALILCLAMCFGMAACGKNPVEPTSAPESSDADTDVTSTSVADATGTEATADDNTTTEATQTNATDTTAATETKADSDKTTVATQTKATNESAAKTSSTKATNATQTKTTTGKTTKKADDTNVYRNLCKGFVDGVDMKDMWKTYDWDKENKYVTASHSLECAWGYGYGKSYLFDGVKATSSQMFDMGTWVSCTVKPGWGAYEGEIDNATVSWKKKPIDEYLIIDLQKLCKIDKVTFSTLYKATAHGMPADFTIEVSDDKSNWTTVKTVTGYEMDITSLDQVFTFNEVAARYVKLHFTKASVKIDDNLAYCIALSELEVWGKNA